MQTGYLKDLNMALEHRAISQYGAENPDSMTRAFVIAASLSDLYDLGAAELALHRSASESVRGLARGILQDARQNAQRLQSTLKIASLELSETLLPYQLDVYREEKMRRLRTMERGAFGEAFVKDQKAGHEAMIDVFRFYKLHGDNEAVRSFARITLTFLERRLEEVDRLV